MNLDVLFKSHLGTFNQAWDRVLSLYAHQDNRLADACHYALSGKGKRVRPLLTLVCADAVGANIELALPAAVAIEMVHTYSLVHDDLPDFDDDSLRRGRPTVHVQYGVPTAILVGDALLTDAWEVLSNPVKYGFCDVAQEKVRLDWVACLAKAAGSAGMVLGQDLDMYWTGKDIHRESVMWQIASRKTADLFAVACSLGALSSGNMTIPSKCFFEFGHHLGLAFQLQDDLLDNTSGTGKSLGKDDSQSKNSALRFFSHNVLKLKVAELGQRAMEALPPQYRSRQLSNILSLLEQRSH